MIDHLLTGELDDDTFWSHPLVAAVLGESLHPGGTKLTLEMAKQAELRPGAHILDVGCGRGTSAKALTEAGYPVTGVDPDPQNIATAQATAAPGCNFRVTDPALGDIEGPFDAVLSECALCLSGDPTATLRRFHRLLKPGGALLLSDVTVERDAQVFQDTIGFIACLGGALDRDGLREVVRTAGFQIQWSDDRPQLIQEIRDRIHKNIDVPALLEALGDPQAPLARLVEQTENAHNAGHLSYAAIVARA